MYTLPYNGGNNTPHIHNRKGHFSSVTLILTYTQTRLISQPGPLE